MFETRSHTVGANQTEVRAYNERLILSVLHRDGSLSGSEMARRTGLSSQTVSVILRKLELDGLIQRGASQKGRVGKPSVPIAISPDGLFSFGVKVGRRSTEVILMDFAGVVRRHQRLRYPYPVPSEVFDFIHKTIDAEMMRLPTMLRKNIYGIGVATPFDLWRWHEQVGASEEQLDAWRELNIQDEMSKFTNLKVYIVNDATAACRAEHMFGCGQKWQDSVYFYIGSFLGGGVVLNHSVYEGSQGNAGALGTLPARLVNGEDGRLLDRASIQTLEKSLLKAGKDTGVVWQQPQDWSSIAEEVDQWLETTAAALARATIACCSVIDFQTVILDGAVPVNIRSRLVERISALMPEQDTRGLIPPRIVEGTMGLRARTVGAATKPLLSGFLLDAHAGFAPH